MPPRSKAICKCTSTTTSAPACRPPKPAARLCIGLGGIEATKEACRDRSSIPYLENLFQDLRFALRQLHKNAAFTFTAVFILALGLCVSVAIFAFVDATLIKPLPYQDPTRLAGVYEHTEKCPFCNISYPDYLDWKKLNHVFRSLDAYKNNGFMLTTDSGTTAVRASNVSDGFFRTLGVKPALGRDFYAGEDLAGAPRTAILSYSTWQTRYGGRADVQGQTATLDGTIHTIIGVLPKDFQFALAPSPEFWTPLDPTAPCLKRRSCHTLYGIGRLKDGVSIESAQADTAVIAKQLEVQYPGSNLGQGANVVPLSEAISGKNRPLLLTLLGGAGTPSHHRLHQCLQPPSGALGKPQTGTRCTHGTGRLAIAPGPSIHYGGLAPGCGRQHDRPDRKSLDHESPRQHDPRHHAVKHALPRRTRLERSCAGVRRRHLACRRPPVLSRPGFLCLLFRNAWQSRRRQPRLRGERLAASRHAS